MDVSAEVDKLTCETAALRNEIWELKELVNRQNERIIYMLQRQNDMLIGMVLGKKIQSEDCETLLMGMDTEREGGGTSYSKASASTTRAHISKESAKSSRPMAKSNQKFISTSRETRKCKKEMPKTEAEYLDEDLTDDETTEYAHVETTEMEMKETTYDDESEQESEASKGFGLETYFPIASQEDLDYVEHKINDKNRDTLIETMKAQMGEAGLTKKLTHIFTLNLIMEYNLDGRQNKKRLLDYPKIMNILFKASKRGNCTRDMFMDDMRKALQLAKKRYIKRRSVLNKKKREMEEIEDMLC